MEQIKYLGIEIRSQHKEWWLAKCLLEVVGLNQIGKISGNRGEGDYSNQAQAMWCGEQVEGGQNPCPAPQVLQL